MCIAMMVPSAQTAKFGTENLAVQDTANTALADVIAALSYALDITEGQPEGHAAKSCLIAMRIAEEIALPNDQRSALFYGTLLKDSGCSSNAAKVCSLFGTDDRAIKQSFKINDLTNKAAAFKYMVRNVAPDRSPLARAAKVAALVAQPSAGKEMILTRCSRGADIALKLGFSQAAAAAVRALDEHWDGRGEPYNLKGDAIPLLGRIACLAQTIEVFFSEFGLVAAMDVARERCGTWFDPELVKTLTSISATDGLWSTIDRHDIRADVVAYEPADDRLLVTEDRLDAIAEGFADVIDAKSPWTSRHSVGVAEAMIGILQQYGYSSEQTRYWRRAALLHDIGKLGVSNMILDKPDKLTDDEFAQMKTHVDHTRRILKLVPCFRNFADDAAAHHEKLDGSGYSLGLTGDELSTEARALCVADIFDALSAKRPYRKRQLELDEVFSIIDKDAGAKLCPIACEALKLHVSQRQSS